MFPALAFVLILFTLDWDSAQRQLNVQESLLGVSEIEYPREIALNPEECSQKSFPLLCVSNRAGPISLLHAGESELVTLTNADTLFSDVLFVRNYFLNHALWADYPPIMPSSFIHSFPSFEKWPWPGMHSWGDGLWLLLLFTVTLGCWVHSLFPSMWLYDF